MAFHTVLHDIGEHLNMPPHELIGQRVDEYIAERLDLKGGGHPTSRAVRKLVRKCADSSWYPSKEPENTGGRPPVYSDHQKAEVARVAMDLKRKLIAPTPRLVRARLPQIARNPSTGMPMSNKAIHSVFTTLCFDEDEDDPWQWLPSPAQDYIPESLKPLRVKCAQHILKEFSSSAWYSHVAIDPCSSLLPRTAQRLEDQQVAAMGNQKWMSPASARKGANLRAPATAKKQGGKNVLQVHWTPVFARGKIHLYVCDADAASRDASLPCKLNDSANLAKFIRNVLPAIQQVAAMGNQKWMSPASARKGANLRAPATAKKQGGKNVLQVHWTPVFARGKIHLYVCDADAASRDASLPCKLNDSANLAKFIRNVLPAILQHMKCKYKWANIPRTIVHDKASYMVTPSHDRLQVVFCAALQEAGFTSWIGDNNSSCEWLVARWGDVYLHETAISHVRRLLDTDFPCTHIHETAKQFEKRMAKVQDHMNSDYFNAGGGGLHGLARSLHERCKEVLRRKGERVPK